MRWSRLVLLLLVALLPACASGPSLPPILPPNLLVGLRVLEATEPPVDYVIKIERDGRTTYETTIRTPRRRRFEGELTLTEDQVVRLYDAVLASGFDDLDPAYTADEGAEARRESGERIFYVVAGDLDKRIDANYVTVPELDELQARILAELPPHVLEGSGGPDLSDASGAFVADREGKVFHRPGCDLIDRIPQGVRVSFQTQFDALNFQYHPCEICKPLDARR